jgi:UPF0755 protein
VIIAGVIIKLDYDHAIKTTNSQDTTKVSIVVDNGETVDKILSSLVDNGLLNKNWENYFKVYLKLNNLTNKLQAGTYNIPKNLNIVQLIQTLQSGTNEVWVTVPEGLRKDEIADIFVENLGSSFSKDTFLSLTTDQSFISTLGLNSNVKDLEGYLFPDTYKFDKDTTEKEVIQNMVDNFKTKIGTNDSYQTIILASILEREGSTTEDRQLESGIILKRYNEGWTLGLDTTTLYYLKTWNDSALTADVLAEDNAYNTRVNTGFPPTPISNPGLDSINAARNPKDSDYYYFYSCKGDIEYAITNDQHLTNVQNCSN